MYPLQRQPAKPEPGQGRDSALSARVAGAKLGLEKRACGRSTKTLPAGGTNLLLVLLNTVVNKKLVMNTKVSFSSISSPSREITVTHSPSPPQGKWQFGVLPWAGLGCGKTSEIQHDVLNAH